MRVDLTVEAIMTNPVTALKLGDSIGGCRETMGVAAVRYAPVVDEHDHFIGCVSNRDLHRATQQGLGTIADIVSRTAHTVRPTTPALQAVRIMIDQGMACLPVVGPDERLIGIVTESDVLALAHRLLLAREPRQAES